MRILPANVNSCHIPYGHFGSGIWLIHAITLQLLQNPFPDKINIISWHVSLTTHVSKMILLVGKAFPHPMGVLCTHLEPHKCLSSRNSVTMHSGCLALFRNPERVCFLNCTASDTPWLPRIWALLEIQFPPWLWKMHGLLPHATKSGAHAWTLKECP